MDESLTIDGDRQVYILSSVLNAASRIGMRTDIHSVSRKYPAASTLHEVAMQAVGADDRDSIRILSAVHHYIPVRWDAFIPLASGPILHTLLPVLSPRGKVDASYRIGDRQLIDRYTQAIQLSNDEKVEYSIKYKYFPGVPDYDMRVQVQALSMERIAPLLSMSHYILILGYALEYGRVDVIDMVISQFSDGQGSNDASVVQLLSLTSQYTRAQSNDYMSMAKESMQYLMLSGYIQVSNTLKAICTDNPSYLMRDESDSDTLTTQIISMNEISLIFYYDSINMWKMYENEYPIRTISSLLHMVHGKIHRHILLSLSDGVTGKDDMVIRTLLRASPAYIMDEMLSLHDNIDTGFEPLKLHILIVAASRGYIEILDKHMTEYTMYRVLSDVSVYPSLCVHDQETIADLLDFKCKDSSLQQIGTYLLSIWVGDHTVSVPPHICGKYLASAIIAGNMDLIATLMSRVNLSNDDVERARLLAQQSHPIDVHVYRSIIRLLQ